MNEIEQVTEIFPQRLRHSLIRAGTGKFRPEELRLRIGQPFLMAAEGREWYLRADGNGWEPLKEPEQLTKIPPFAASAEDIRETMEYMSRYSLYAFEEELRQGFLTIPGGHRIGVAGQAVLEGGRVRTLKYISCINVRIARQIRGCADPVIPWLYPQGHICSTLIISPPGCGKTTLLRDLIRQVSDGQGTKHPGVTVGVVDERSELGACCQGRPQNDLGIRTDLLDGCPKAAGMMMLIRSMAPQVVAVDEIGSQADLEAIRYGKNCGCRLLATVHGCSLEDIRKKPVLKEFVSEGVFERYIVLKGAGRPGQIGEILDGAGACLYPPGNPRQKGEQ